MVAGGQRIYSIIILLVKNGQTPNMYKWQSNWHFRKLIEMKIEIMILNIAFQILIWIGLIICHPIRYIWSINMLTSIYQLQTMADLGPLTYC